MTGTRIAVAMALGITGLVGGDVSAQGTTGDVTATPPVTAPGVFNSPGVFGTAGTIVVAQGTTTTPGATTTTTGTNTGTTGTTTTTGANGAAGTVTGAGVSSTATQAIAELTNVVPPSDTPVGAFTVPAGSTLVITDVLLTNPNPSAACNLSIGRTAQPALTGALCVPPLTTLQISFTSGIDYPAGDVVELSNPTSGAAGPITFHLRGVLVPAAG